MNDKSTTSKTFSFEDVARLVLDSIEAVGLDYLVGGAVAVWAYAEPRATRDFDVVIHLPGSRIRSLSEELGKRGMLLPPEVIVEVLLQPDGDVPLNAIHGTSGVKADIYLLRSGDEYRATALARRRLVDFGPPLGNIYVHAPEDLMLNKLHYFSLSNQDKHIRDIAAIVAYTEGEIEWGYFNGWLERLGLVEVWYEVKRAIEALLDK